MRRVCLLIIFYIILCLAIPILFTKRINIVETGSKTNNLESFDYKQYNLIKLLHSETGQIEEIQLDEYLKGVISAEMPASYNIEALKAQAVVARTYTIYKIINGSKHEGANICDKADCCQAWISKEDRMAKWNEADREENWKKITEAVDSTKGQIITYNNQPINAFFHSNSGGITETAGNVWGGTNYEYLQAVETAGEDAYSQYSSEVEITKEEFINKIREYHTDIEIDFLKQDAIQILEYTESGRVKKVKFGNLSLSGTEVRTIFGLKSTMFTIEINEQNILFKVTGYGHGVGMSQTGADSMAKLGNNYEEIIKHYYTGVEIINTFFE